MGVGSRHGRAKSLVSLAATFLSVACTAISGVDGLHVGEAACGADCRGGADGGADVRIIASSTGSSCACVGAPPAGWEGPVSLWEGSGAAPECAGDYPAKGLDAFRDPNAPDPICSCACGDPTGITCPTSFALDIYGSPACGAAEKCDTVNITTGACTNVQTKCTFADGVSGGPTPAGGSCAPQAGNAVVPPWSWKANVRTCMTKRPPARESCDGAEVCVPLPAAPMLPRPCIFMSGDVACPAGGYGVKHVVYGGADDQRKCTPCTCGAPTGATCSASITKGCSTTGPKVTLPTTCSPLGDPISVGLFAAPIPSGGSCAPTGGKREGALVPTSPTTVCCVP